MYKRPVFTLLPVQEEHHFPFSQGLGLSSILWCGAEVTEEEAAQSHHLHGSQTLSVSSVTTSGVFYSVISISEKKKNTMLYDGFT